MEVIEKELCRYSTKVIIKYSDNVLVYGWVEDSVVSWILNECKYWPELSISTGSSKIKKQKDIFLKKDIINKIYFGLQGLKNE
jgi:hypothetical protein